MSKETTLDPDLYPTLPTTKPTAQEDALAQWFAKQHTQSIDNLEGAARQIITLCTTLLTVLLGLAALTADALPTYMNATVIRWLIMVGVLALFSALGSALIVVFPGATRVTLNDPKDLAAAYDKLLAFKNTGLSIAIVAFGIAMFCLTIVILGALWVV